MSLDFGQIGPSNFAALLAHYGGPPPWPMERAPHLDLVRAVRAGGTAARSSYERYLGDRGALAEHVAIVRSLLDADRLTIQTEAGCIIDGNHRWAVSQIAGIPLVCEDRAPYQTIAWPDGTITEGRRLGAPRIPTEVDLEGATVLELGAAQSAVSVEACQRGAARVYAVDRLRTSLPWRLVAAWGLGDRWLVDRWLAGRVSLEVADANELSADAYSDATVLLAMSVTAYLQPGVFERFAAGRRCLLECHGEHQPPATGHRWRRLPDAPYSRAVPDAVRSVYWGEP